MIGQVFDTMIVASTDKEWLSMTHLNLNLGKWLETVLSHLKTKLSQVFLLMLFHTCDNIVPRVSSFYKKRDPGLGTKSRMREKTSTNRG